MATPRNKLKLTVISRETQEHPRNSQSQNTSDPGNSEEYYKQVSEEIIGNITKKLSQEFSWSSLRVGPAIQLTLTDRDVSQQ